MDHNSLAHLFPYLLAYLLIFYLLTDYLQDVKYTVTNSFTSIRISKKY